MLLFRLYFWSHPPMMLLYMKVDFIPAELVDTFYWPLLFVMDHCPLWDAQYTEITYFWWFLDWFVFSALQNVLRGRFNRPSATGP